MFVFSKGALKKKSMFQSLNEISNSILALKISSEITDKEFEQLCNIVEKRISAFGAIRIFLVAEHYASFNSAESLFEDLRFLKRYADKIEKIAVVCDKVWKKTWIALFGLFSGIRTEYFDAQEFKKARQWLNED